MKRLSALTLCLSLALLGCSKAEHQQAESLPREAAQTPPVAAEAPTQASPRCQARVACHNGTLDSGSVCSVSNFQPDGTLHTKGKMTCGFPGKVSEIEWSFVERRGSSDLYRFTRRFPSDTAAVSTTSRNVEFSDKRVIVFQDQFQAIVIEPPME